MQVLIWVFVIMILAGSSVSSFGDELIAQNTNPVPASTSGTLNNSEQDRRVCSDDELLDSQSDGTKVNACIPDFVVEQDAADESAAPNMVEIVVENDQDDVSILPNTEIDFVEDYMVKYDNIKSKNTVFYGGVVPFVALPDSELATEDSFFNEESFSVFLYFKRKF